MKQLKLIFLGALIFRLFLAPFTWHPDVTNHIDWGTRFWQYAPNVFYEANVWNFTWPNQPPATMLLFGAIRKLYEGVFGGLWLLNINIPIFPSFIISWAELNLYPAMLKLPAIFADIGLAWIIFKFTKEIANEKKAKLASVIFLLNPVVWYNSSLWGQTDSIINFFAIFGFYLLLARRLAFAMLAMAASLYFKASLLIFLPIFLLIAWRQKYRLKDYLLSVLPSIMLIVLTSLPFSKGNIFLWLFYLYKDKVIGQQMQVITANAFNIWAAIAGIHEKPHSLPLGPLSYGDWGLLAFALFYLPLLYLVYKKQDCKTVVVVLLLASLSSFMLLTNMHERYLYPAFAPFTIIAVSMPWVLPFYIGFSIVNLLNLYNLWWYPRFDLLVNLLSAEGRFLPRILGGFNFLAFIALYQKLFVNTKTGLEKTK